MPTGKQIRAARVLAEWDAGDLAQRIGMSRVSVQNLERGDSRPKPETVAKIVRVFSDAGIEFIENEGLRRKPNGLEVYEGLERFEEFYNFLYEHLRDRGGNVCLSVTDERLLAKYRKNATKHYERMQDLHNRGVVMSFRILAGQSDWSTRYSYHEYKCQPDFNVSPTAFYVFGECLALISFTHNPHPYVVVLQSAPIADSYRQAFNSAWAVAKDPPLQTGTG